METDRNMESATVAEKIVEHLSSRIEGGEIAEGGRLPSRADLARDFNTSRTTVTTAFSTLSERYVLDFVAGKGVFLVRKQIRRSTRILGLIGPMAGRFLSDGGSASAASYWGAIVRSVIDHAAQRNMAAMVIPNTDKEPLDVNMVQSLGVSCLVNHGVRRTKATLLELRRRGIPIVLGSAGDAMTHAFGASHVDYANAGMAREAVRLCHERGHRVMGFIAFTTSWSSEELMRDAFLLEAARLGVPLSAGEYCHIYGRGYDEKPYAAYIEERIVQMLALDRPPTAVFCDAPPRMAQAVARAAQRRGLTLGRDFSAVFSSRTEPEDEPCASAFVAPSLELGRTIVETAEKLIQTPDDAFSIELPYAFVDKGTLVDLRAPSIPSIVVHQTESEIRTRSDA